MAVLESNATKEEYLEQATAATKAQTEAAAAQDRARHKEVTQRIKDLRANADRLEAKLHGPQTLRQRVTKLTRELAEAKVELAAEPTDEEKQLARLRSRVASRSATVSEHDKLLKLCESNKLNYANTHPAMFPAASQRLEMETLRHPEFVQNLEAAKAELAAFEKQAKTTK